MTTKEEVESFIKQYGGPGESFNIVDSKGKTVETYKYSEHPELVEATKEGGTGKVYKTKSGGFTADASSQDIVRSTNLSANKKTGNIDIVAPKEFTDSSYYKNNIAPVLTNLSQVYKTNPDSKFKLYKDNEEAKTVNDWLKDIQADIDKNINDVVRYEIDKKRKSEEAGFDFTDSDMIKMNTFVAEYNKANGQTVQIKDTDRQVIPKALVDGVPALQKLEGYDEGTHSVDWANLKKVFNRDNTSDEDLLDVYNVVDNYFKYYNSDNGYKSNSEEYAEYSAFKTFLDNNHPEAGFWKSVGDVITTGGYGAVLAGLDTATEFNDIVSGIAGFFGVESKATDKARGDLTEWRKQNEKRIKRMGGTDISGLVEGGLDIAVQVSIGNMAGSLAVGAFKGLISTTTAAVKSYSNLANMVLVTAKYDDIYEMALGAQKFHAAGISASLLPKIETMCANLYLGTETMLKLIRTTEERDKWVSAAIKTLNKVESSKKIAGTLDLAAQATVDIVLSDSKLFHDFLADENVTDEEKSYMFGQIRDNVIFWGVGKQAGKLGKYASESSIGRVVNEEVANKSAWLKAKMDNATMKISDFLHKGDTEWEFTKAEKYAERANDGGLFQKRNEKKAVEYYRKGTVKEVNKDVFDKAYENIGKQKIIRGSSSWDEIVEKANKSKAYRSEQLSAANRLADTIYSKSTARTSAKLTAKYANVRGSRNVAFEQAAKVSELELRDGLIDSRTYKAAKKAEESAAGKISNETNQYIASRYRARQLQVYRKTVADPNLYKQIDQELSHLNNIISTYRKAHSGDLVEAADGLYGRLKQWQNNIVDMAISEKVTDKLKIDELRNLDMFKGGNYLHLRRVKDPAYKTKDVFGVKTVFDAKEMQHIKPGSTDEYADIISTVVQDQENVAKAVMRKETVSDLKKLGTKMEYVVTEDEMRLVSRVSPIKDKVLKNISKSSDKYISDISDDFIRAGFKRERAQMFIRNAEHQTEKSGLKINTEYVTKKYAPRKTDKIEFINNLTQDGINDMFWSKYDGPFSNIIRTEDDFQEFLGKLDVQTRQELVSDMEGQVGYLYDKAATKEELLANLPKYDKSSWESITRKDVPAWAKPYVVDEGGEIITDGIQIQDIKNNIDSIKKTKNASVVNLDNFKSFVSNDEDYILDMQKKYISRNKEMLDDGDMNNAITTIKREKRAFDNETLYRENRKRLQEIKERYNVSGLEDDMNDQIDELIDQVIQDNLSNTENKKAFDEIASAIGRDSDVETTADEITEYITLKSLTKKGNMNNMKEKFRRIANKEYNKMLTEAGVDSAVVNRRANELADNAAEWLDDRINQRYANVSRTLQDAGNPIVDSNDIFYKQKEYAEKITKAEEDTRCVKTYGDNGVAEYVRLSPAMAKIITTAPPQMPINSLTKFTNQIFRMNTTGGLVPGSLVNQGFRDTGNAVFVGDAIKGISRVQDELYNEFGEQFIEYYQKNVPDVYEYLMKQASDEGKSIKKKIIEYESSIGKANVDTELESKLYTSSFGGPRFARDKDGVYSDEIMETIKTKMDDIMEKSEYLNNKREAYLRQRVYLNNLQKSLKEGLSIQEARNIAEFVQSEATTNFNRWTYHFTNLQQTVPYLGAAINGAKSFWRLVQYDPVGVAGRITGGLVLPIMAMMNETLSNEDNRRIYKQIKEYQKDDAFVFVYGGQAFSIPLPQEIATITRTIQSAVEAQYDANEHSLNELMLNNLVGFSPIDLSGFVNIDKNPLIQSNSWVDGHLLPGVSRVASSMLPPVAKSAVILATGVDPYTMKQVDTSYVTVDPETGEQLVMNSSANEFAKLVSNIFGGQVSAPMAQAVLNNLIGKEGIHTVLDTLVGLGSSVVDSDEETTPLSTLADLAEREIGGMGDKLTVSRYGEESNSLWKQATSALYREKTEMLNSEEYNANLRTMNDNTATDEARNKAKSRVETMQREFFDKVLSTTQKLVDIGGTYDKSKFASTISLMTFDSGYISNITNPAAMSAQKELFNQSRAAAIETMNKMGFNSTNDISIFGYIDKNGNVTYSSPISILDYGNIYSRDNGLTTRSDGRDEIDYANISALIKNEDIYNKKQDFQKKINKIYSKGKLKDADYKKINQIQLQNNEMVIKSLAPYINKMTPEVILSNERIFNDIKKLFMVPSEFKKNARGYYVTNKNLGEGDANAAYVESYIKRIYRMDDRANYGKNYSNRK